MIEITGEYNKAVIYTDAIEESARGQIQALCDSRLSSGSNIRIMPDVHAGAGCTIGTTMTITDTVIPNLVGVDIGCGMETVELEDTRIDLPKLDSVIHSRIPAGMDVRDTPQKYLGEVDIHDLRCADAVNVDRGELSIGTLGGGNHFIEIDEDDDGRLYLVVHSGSRNLGLQVAEYYQKKGYEALGGKAQSEVPYELAYVSGELLDDYLHDMRIMQEYAEVNRHAMADEILKGMKLHEASRFTTTHNYIDIDSKILRKGAVSAKDGERLLIPINMRDGSLICTGKGNPEWNYSAPHGAGRIMSRGEARRSFTMSSYKHEMEGIFSTTVNDETLDECPMAYKNMDEIIANIEPTAKIEKQIKPIYNFKASESPRSKKRKR
jgi:RNA-splicing ligase RtcB